MAENTAIIGHRCFLDKRHAFRDDEKSVVAAKKKELHPILELDHGSGYVSWLQFQIWEYEY